MTTGVLAAPGGEGGLAIEPSVLDDRTITGAAMQSRAAD
jgi:hypothetical protein